jgi:hypothetical protein
MLVCLCSGCASTVAASKTADTGPDKAATTARRQAKATATPTSSATLLYQAQQAGRQLSSDEQALATTMIENSNDDAA